MPSRRALVRVILVPLIERLDAMAPSLRIALLPLAARGGSADLESGECDLLIVSEHLAPETARARPLLEETFVVIQRKKHPRGTGSIDLRGFCEVEHVLVSPEGGGFVGAIDDALAGTGQTRRVAVSLPNFLLAPPLVTVSAFADRPAVTNLFAALGPFFQGLVPRPIAARLRGQDVRLLPVRPTGAGDPAPGRINVHAGRRWISRGPPGLPRLTVR